MRRRGRGQSLVEFALVVPLLFGLLFSVFDLGRGIWASDIASHAASEAARYAIVHGGAASDPCPVGPPAATAVIPTASTSCPYPSPSKQSIYDMAMASTIAAGGDASVTVCYGQGCTGDTDTAGGTNQRGTPVTVVVTVHITILTGALIGAGSFNVSSTSTMLVNH